MADGMSAAVLYTAITMVTSYLVCGIPFGKIIIALTMHKDIQKEGSGNIGTTNALRVGGPKVAALTLAFDLLKGMVCVMVFRDVVVGGNTWTPDVPVDLMVALVALSALYGHIFSPYLKFHGGKGIATGVGILFGFCWPLALIHLAIFIVLVALTRYVSVGSIATAAVVPLTVHLAFPDLPLAALAVWALLGWTVVWAHRGNISRLRAGTESKLSLKKKGEPK